MDISETGLEMARKKVPAGVFLRQDFTQTLTIPETYFGWATHAVCTEGIGSRVGRP